VTTGGPEICRVITRPEDAAGLLLSRFSFKCKENFGILILDTKNQVKKEKIISIGSLNASIVHPREIFYEAIMESAASLILFHNHPSGDPTPSKTVMRSTSESVSAPYRSNRSRGACPGGISFIYSIYVYFSNSIYRFFISTPDRFKPEISTPFKFTLIMVKSF